MNPLGMKAKVCMVGEAEVGKTSLVRRLALDLFDDRYAQTLGTRVTKKKMKINHPDMRVELDLDMMIWDIMGQRGFYELLRDVYFHGAKGALAVCDVTKVSTLDNLGNWIDGVRRVSEGIPVVIAVNKVDLKSAAEFSEEDARRAAAKHRFPCHFTSAKTGENVESTFRILAEAIARGQLSREGAPTFDHVSMP